MLRFRAGNAAAIVVLMALVAGCSREQQDWRAAEAADSVEGYSQFLQRHPESELATEARTRVAQLAEEHEWQQAGQTDTADAYRQFLAQHPNGKWSQEARIRIQNFALNGLPPAGPPMAAEESATGSAVSSAAGAAAAAGTAGADGAGSAEVTGSSALASGAAAAAANAAAAAANAAPAKATAAEAARSVAATHELAQAPGSARVSPAPEQTAIAVPAKATLPAMAVPGESATVAAARAPAIALSTPYVSSPNTSSPANIASGSGGIVGYGIQLGAFTNEGAANIAWQQLTARFGPQLQGLSARVVAANTATGPLFRLQAPVGDASRARALCDMLRKQSQACLLVLPH